MQIDSPISKKIPVGYYGSLIWKPYSSMSSSSCFLTAGLIFLSVEWGTAMPLVGCKPDRDNGGRGERLQNRGKVEWN